MSNKNLDERLKNKQNPTEKSQIDDSKQTGLNVTDLDTEEPATAEDDPDTYVNNPINPVSTDLTEDEEGINQQP